jgi:hypothetical protein
MAFRFRRSIKLLQVLRLNVGKRGVSTSIGIRGIQVTFGKTSTRTRFALPGTGLSCTHLAKPNPPRAPVTTTHLDPATLPGSGARGMLWIALIVAILIAAVLVHLAQS